MRKVYGCVVAVLSFCISYPAPAATPTPKPPLADRVPADAIVYIGWAGSETLYPKYNASHLKSVLDGSDMPKLFDEVMPQLVKKVAKQDPDAAEVLRQVMDIGAPLWKHPTAFYFGGIDWHGQQPWPHLAVLCDAGPDAADLASRISKLMAQAPKDQGPMPIVKTYGSLVVFAFGTDANIGADFADAPASNLAIAPKFKAALAQVQPDTAVVEYIDADAGVKMIDTSMAKMGQPQITEKWNHARDALALTGLHQMIATAGFDGRGWTNQSFVACANGTQGILGFLNPTPLSADLLRAVPQSADDLMAGKFNIDAFVGQLHDEIAQFDEQTAEQMDDAIGKFNEIAGLDLRKDVLASLGDEWVLYSDRTVGGSGFMGSIIVNHLKDPGEADKAFTQLAQRANAIIASQMHEPDVKIEFHDSVVGGVTLHFLAVPFVTPCWAVKDGNLYLGLYPQIVSAAVEQVSKKQPSILQRTEFAAVMKQLGDHPACSVSFSNLPFTAREGYSGILALSRMYLGMGDVFGLHVPPMIIPPLSKIAPELSPAGSVTWTDANGFHMKSVSPFPGSEMFAGSSIGSSAVLGEGSLMVSILLPSLNKARETANRAKCASNEHQIGLGLLLYANENNQKLPDDLGTMMKAEGMTMSVFLCPSGKNELPPNAATMTPDEQAAWVNEHSDYIYLGKGLKENNVAATTVIVFEKDDDHQRDGMNILYGDGHAEWQTRANALRQINAAKGR